MAVIEVEFPGNISKVDTAVDLRALPSPLIANGALYAVSGLGIFSYSTSSVAIDDGVTVLKPDDRSPLQAGRWLISGGAVFASDSDIAALSDVLTPQIQQATVFKQDASAAVTRTTQSKARETVSVIDFGAKGDGTSDDVLAIQAALDFIGAAGGGTVILPPTSGRYRITDTLKLPSYTTLQGIAPARYPFNAALRATLVADFTVPQKWIIEPKTTHNGQPFAYNEMTTARLPGGGLPNGPTFNCAVRDLVVTSTGALPYGGIRMHGCPGSVVENVGINNVGCGLLVNCCFGGWYSVNVLTAYYGVIAWDDVNGNSFEIYAARQPAFTGVVPDAYQTSAMSGLFNTLVGVHGMAKNDHFNRATGLIMGSSVTTINTNVVEYVGERYTNGFFHLYAYSTHFTKFYVESDAGVMLTAVAGARSSIKFDTYHAYLSGGGEYWDTGFAESLDVTVNGIAFARSWGSIRAENATSVIFRGPTVEDFGPGGPQYNIRWEKPGAWKFPTLVAPTTDAGAPELPTAYRRENTRVFLQGAPTGTANATMFVLPVGYRPSGRITFDKFLVTASGEVIATAAGIIPLGGRSWEA